MNRSTDKSARPASTTPKPEKRAPNMVAAANAAKPKAPSWLGISLAVAISSILAWQVIVTTVARGLAENRPELALTLSPNEPAALLRLVDREVHSLIRLQASEKAAAQAPKNSTTAEASSAPRQIAPQMSIYISSLRAMTLRALRAEPTSAQAVRILGQLAEIEGNDEKAVELYRIAARRSKHESVAVLQTARHAFEQKDYSVFLEYSDALLRTRQDLASFIFPMFARLAETEATAPLLLDRLQTSPPWRGQLIPGILPGITDARTPLRIMTAMKQRGQPPTKIEIRSYLNFLLGHQLPEVAYYAWLQLLTPEQLENVRPVNNGQFKENISGLPFDWTLQSGAGTAVEIAATPSPEYERALQIVFNSGRSELGTISQTLLLSQGSYVFNVKVMGELIGRRGLKWVLSCSEAQSPRPLGETEMFIGSHPAWRNHTFAFTVPAENCKSQQLRLILDARSASEQIVSGRVLYTDVAVTRN